MNQLHKYLFTDQQTRIQTVYLEEAWQQAFEHRSYPTAVQNLLGELTAAAVLLAGNLKMKGSLILQAQGEGPIALLVVECTSDLNIRATVNLREDTEIPTEGTLQTLLNPDGQGRFVTILEPADKQSFQPYQGIVPLQGDTVTEVLQNYMHHSEQLDTRLCLAANEQRAAGILLQRLPANENPESEQSEDSWDRSLPLLATVQPDELLSLDNESLIKRLFWQEDLLKLPSQPVEWHCPCSRERVANMLQMLGEEEVNDILQEQGSVEVACQFCGQPYSFDAVDCTQIFTTGNDSSPSDQVH
ncbi:MAG TPA: Hsp33 family molecular chaperone HslO [Paenalcaligenes sp.]|nr:Hsp33 family molecular chaperone HslO [Paenalcaligenes sp.]